VNSIENQNNANLAQCTSESDVICVIVTYADRKSLLLTVLEGLLDQGVRRVIVVDNGSDWPVKDELSLHHGEFVDVVEMSRNTGSAGGYSAGIQRAMDLGAKYIWLLDDDNLPGTGCLEALLSAYNHLRKKHSTDHLAVLAFRPEHQVEVAAGMPLHRINTRRNSFLGFHICDIPYKFWRRTPWGRPRVQEKLSALFDVAVAPYSGLLLPRTAVNAIGLPRKDFVLYADDHEYTSRITHAGGRIVLVTNAYLEDLEKSWNVRKNAGNSFGVLLSQGSEFRVYYSTRNATYLSTYCRSHDNWMLWLNRRIYLGMLDIIAVLSGQNKRYRLIKEAVDDGLAGSLGFHPRFPL